MAMLSKLRAALFGLALACAPLLALAAPTVTQPNEQGMVVSTCATGSGLAGGGSGNSPICLPTPSSAGTIYYWNGSAWVALAGNTSTTKVLQSTSAGVLSWVAASGTGTVTSVVCGSGLSGGTITSTGTCAISAPVSIANGGTNATTATLAAASILPTPTRAGDIVYWNGSAWTTLPGNNSGTLFLQETASGVPSFASVSGSGTVTSVICGTGLSGGTITTSGTCALALTNATLEGLPTPPSAITSTSLVMAGLATTAQSTNACVLTPVYSGRVTVNFRITVYNSTAGDFVAALPSWGTGTAPVAAASATGTTIGVQQNVTSSAANAFNTMTIGGIVKGLTPGTAYWFDLQWKVNGGTGNINSVSCDIEEF